MSSKPLLFDPLLGSLLKAVKGDKKAAEVLVRSISPKLFGLAYRLLQNRADAEEVTQEALLRLWKVAKDWRKGEALIETWAYRVVTNLSFDKLRSAKKFDADQIEDDIFMDDKISPESELINRDISNEIDRALAQLPPRQRAVIVFTYFEAMGAKDTAAAMETSIEAVESLLSRARKTLKQVLLNDEPELLNEFVAAAAI